MVSLARKKQAVGLKLSLSNQLAVKLSKLNETLQLVTYLFIYFLFIFKFLFFFFYSVGIRLKCKLQPQTSAVFYILTIFPFAYGHYSRRK